jgi:ribosomal protein L12E/L44/L45/RPP1/RPP2
MALNEETAKRADALADSRLELERASAKLGMDASEGAYQRYNDKLAIYQQANNRYEDILLAQANAEAAQSTALSAASVKGGIKMAELQSEAVLKALESDQMSEILRDMRVAQTSLASGQLNEYEATQTATELQRLAAERDALIGLYTGTAGTGRTLTVTPDRTGLQ